VPDHRRPAEFPSTAEALEMVAAGERAPGDPPLVDSGWMIARLDCAVLINRRVTSVDALVGRSAVKIELP
jgi:hypothetical protein